MKSVLIIGMGRTGRHLAKKMQTLGNDVMVVDNDAKVIEMITDIFPDAAICDCTNEAVIRSLGVDNFDVCFVTIGEDFQASLVITSLLKSHGARKIVAKTNQDIQSELLRKIGADEIVYAEYEAADKLAVRYNADNILDFVPLTDEYSMYEIPVLKEWIGHTVIDLDIRKKYKINIIAVKQGERLNPNIGPNYTFHESDLIFVIGKSGEVFSLAAKV